MTTKRHVDRLPTETHKITNAIQKDELILTRKQKYMTEEKMQE